mmetsp:Transcript_98167/g.253872  ORF Transcript_98167/g.253872 Transcript_98167/m.253872 type:complete len:207 (-) Transcript_98167:866-1486(-)
MFRHLLRRTFHVQDYDLEPMARLQSLDGLVEGCRTARVTHLDMGDAVLVEDHARGGGDDAGRLGVLEQGGRVRLAGDVRQVAEGAQGLARRLLRLLSILLGDPRRGEDAERHRLAALAAGLLEQRQRLLRRGERLVSLLLLRQVRAGLNEQRRGVGHLVALERRHRRLGRLQCVLARGEGAAEHEVRRGLGRLVPLDEHDHLLRGL